MTFFFIIFSFLFSTNIFAETKSLIFRWNLESLKAVPLNIVLAQDFIPVLGNEETDPSGLNPIELMAQNWNLAHPVLDFFSLPFTVALNREYTNLDDFLDDEIGIYYSKNWYLDLNPSSLAVTQFFGSRKNPGTSSEYFEISHSDIIVNFKNIEFSTKLDFNKYDLLTVLVHEMGHLIGLAHNKNQSIPSIMSPYLAKGEQRRDLASFDVETILKYYPTESTISKTKSNLLNIEEPKKMERYIIELRTDASCHHYLNRQFLFSH